MSVATREISIHLAGPPDDEELRRLLRENPMAGDISLSLEREPSFFAAAELEGEGHQTVLGREPKGRAVGLFSRSERRCWVNGAQARVGYLGSLRLDPSYRGRFHLVKAGFDACHALHQQGRVPYYVTSIVEDNAPARRLLTSHLPGLPVYRPRGRMVTFVYEVPRWVRSPLEVRPAVREHRPFIARLLAEDHRRFQFAPVVDEAELGSPVRSAGLRPADFLVLERDGELKGCVAVWDQRAFKQTVVRGYDGWLARARPAYNVAARLVGKPVLPKVGDALPHAYLAHLAVRGDDPTDAERLLAGAFAAARARGIRYLSLGLGEAHPLAAVARRRRAREYPSILYLVHWEDGAAAADAVQDGPVHVEVATL